ncbi:MAG: hypothetical protein HY565_02515 [Candidatus Kerfeldbacteria bacterium]|nr:hypothetical protein [Candidatus Kerfeldbacteria bacterium]
MKRWLLITTIVVVAGCGQVTEPIAFGSQSVVWGEVQSAADQPAEQWSWPTVSEDTVITIWPYALWDQASCHSDWPSVVTLLGTSYQAPYPPCDQTAYDTWLRAAVTQYQTKVVAWQVVAAPAQQDPPFANYIGSASSYADLSVHTAQTLHAADPAALVMVGEMSTASPNSITWFVDLLARSDVQTNLDLFSTSVDNAVLKSLLDKTSWTKPVWVVGADQLFYTDL